MVTPVISQQELCQRIIRHWVDGFGSQYNHTRQEAFATTWLADSLEDVIKSLQKKFDCEPMVMMTSAREHVADECGKPMLSFRESRRRLREESHTPCLMVLGTGYGIENECIRTYSDVILEPIRGVGDYNHLSVRSAAAIMFDRLFGRDDLQLTRHTPAGVLLMKGETDDDIT